MRAVPKYSQRMVTPLQYHSCQNSRPYYFLCMVVNVLSTTSRHCAISSLLAREKKHCFFKEKAVLYFITILAQLQMSFTSSLLLFTVVLTISLEPFIYKAKIRYINKLHSLSAQ